MEAFAPMTAATCDISDIILRLTLPLTLRAPRSTKVKRLDQSLIANSNLSRQAGFLYSRQAFSTLYIPSEI